MFPGDNILGLSSAIVGLFYVDELLLTPSLAIVS